MGVYTGLVRPALFRLDAERAHRLAIGTAARLGRAAGALRPLAGPPDPRLATRVAGIHFPTPLGLAAGFDKSGTAVDALAALGFGFVEIGSVSLDPSAGNPRPRLFRLPRDEAIVVHYGLPNDGAEQVARRLDGRRLPVPLGINLVKTNRGIDAPAEDADAIIADYVGSARRLAPRADYLMLNLSCPNTADGRDFFADRGHLDLCLAALREADLRVPVFLKLSPAGGIPMIETVLAAADPHPFVAGFMFNLPSGKPAGLATPEAAWRAMPGAVSGPPAAALAEASLRELVRRMDRQRYAVIAAGGIRTAEDAYARLRLGASLVQILTALVYQGPGVVRRLTDGLARLLERDGVHHVSEVVGVDAAG